MPDHNSVLIYLDTNMYSRPFDDQTRPDIREEANAFLEIVREVPGKFTFIPKLVILACSCN